MWWLLRGCMDISVGDGAEDVILRGEGCRIGEQGLTSDDSICRCDGGDDVLHDTLRERPSDALDLELLRARRSDRVQPTDVFRVVRVEFLVCVSRQSGRIKPKQAHSPPCTRGHSRTEAHSIQCSGRRGVFAMVQIGKAVGRLSMSSEHS